MKLEDIEIGEHLIFDIGPGLSWSVNNGIKVVVTGKSETCLKVVPYFGYWKYDDWHEFSRREQWWYPSRFHRPNEYNNLFEFWKDE